MTVLIYDSEAKFYAEQLSLVAPDLEFRTATSLEDAIVLAKDAKVLVALAPWITPDLLAAAPNLEWIQALTTGVDNVRNIDGVALTNCGGFHGPQMSELVVLMMLALLRRFPQMVDAQKAHTWDRKKQPILQGRTTCILGVGAISEYLASVLNAFGMTVTGVTSRATAPGFAHLYPRAQMLNAVGEADFVVVLTPLTDATRNIVDAGVLDAMKPEAFLVNIARGGCVDEAALSKALRDGSIAGAASDVFEQEPLPAASPMWDLPNFIVTPHVGGFADVYHQQALPILKRNFTEYAAGGIDALSERITQ